MNAVEQAYAAIGAYTPIRGDCGLTCAHACCKTDMDGQGGVYLFPGEERLLSDCAWGRVVPDTVFGFAPMLMCDGFCDRDKRPLACRLFPLTPILLKDGTWSVRMDVRAKAMCPLYGSGVAGLDPAFVDACKKAVRLCANDPETFLFLRKWRALERRYACTL